MTEQEYYSELKQIEEDYKSSKMKLYEKFAKENRIYELGDIIKDHCKTILVEKFGVNKTFELPQPIYIGAELKKDLTPKKNQDTGYVYGNSNTQLLKRSL